MSDQIRWMGTSEACEHLGVTLRTLYRFIDEGQLTAYKMGRVIRVQASDIERFIERMRIVPGTLDHLYPEPKPGVSPRAEDPVADPDLAVPDGQDVDISEANLSQTSHSEAQLSDS